MAYLILTGPERQRTNQVLETTHGRTQDLRLLVQYVAPELVPSINWDRETRWLIFQVIDLAEQYGVTSDLLLAAAKERPGRPDLLAFVIELCQAHRGQLQASAYGRALEEVVHPFAGFLNPTLLATRLLCHERHVCAIEVGEKGGTGLLVASDLVLTNYHVVEDLLAGSIRHDDVVCVFDYREGLDGSPVTPVQVELDPAWMIPHRPFEADDVPASHELDYALLRLARPIGAMRPIGEDRERCWFDLSQPPPEPVRDRLAFVLQHPRKELWQPGEPRQQPLKVALGQPGFDGYNTNRTRLRYRVNTLPGSSGSAVFDERLCLVALHNSRGQPTGTSDGRVENNQGIPLTAILADLDAKIRALLIKPRCLC